MRDWTTGSGMSTQASSKWTWTRLLPWAKTVVVVQAMAGEMVAVDEKDEASEGGLFWDWHAQGHKCSGCSWAPVDLCYGQAKTSSDLQRPEFCPYMATRRRSNTFAAGLKRHNPISRLRNTLGYLPSRRRCVYASRQSWAICARVKPANTYSSTPHAKW